MRRNYRESEVRALIEEYAAAKAYADTDPRRGRLNALLALADLNRALDKLDGKRWEVMLLHGLLGLPTRSVAELLHVSHTAIGKRYHQALEDTVFYINGGT